jgi:hypothetical protein
MKVMSGEEAAIWCRGVGPRMTAEGVLQYARAKQYRFFVEAPEEFRLIMGFTRAMLTFRGEASFGGGLLWLRRWDIGSPQFISLGWKIIEGIRRVHGDLRSLETAPAQVFRDDEFLDLHTFLVQVVGFGWWRSLSRRPAASLCISKIIVRCASAHGLLICLRNYALRLRNGIRRQKIRWQRDSPKVNESTDAKEKILRDKCRNGVGLSR